MGFKTFDALKEFVLSRVTVQVKFVTTENWNQDGYKNQQWLLFLCAEDSVYCPEEETRIKLAASLVRFYSIENVEC